MASGYQSGLGLARRRSSLGFDAIGWVLASIFVAAFTSLIRQRLVRLAGSPAS